MRRWILNAATAMSLVLCLGTVVLWVKSYPFNWHPVLDHTWSDGEVVVHSERGKVWVGYVPHPRKGIPSPRWSFLPLSVPFALLHLTSGDREWHRWGFGYSGAIRIAPADMPQNYRPFIGMLCYILVVPYWFLAVLFAILPLVWVIRRWRGRYPKGHCQKCGYDLRGSEGRCPECGAPIPAAADGPAATPSE